MTRSRLRPSWSCDGSRQNPVQGADTHAGALRGAPLARSDVVCPGWGKVARDAALVRAFTSSRAGQAPAHLRPRRGGAHSKAEHTRARGRGGEKDLTSVIAGLGQCDGGCPSPLSSWLHWDLQARLLHLHRFRRSIIYAVASLLRTVSAGCICALTRFGSAMIITRGGRVKGRCAIPGQLFVSLLKRDVSTMFHAPPQKSSRTRP